MSASTGAAFEPFDGDVRASDQRAARIGHERLPVASLVVVAQALEELGRLHSACPDRGIRCDVCWWLSKGISAARAARALDGHPALTVPRQPTPYPSPMVVHIGPDDVEPRS